MAGILDSIRSVVPCASALGLIARTAEANTALATDRMGFMAGVLHDVGLNDVMNVTVRADSTVEHVML
jgi:hypothetical protein